MKKNLIETKDWILFLFILSVAMLRVWLSGSDSETISPFSNFTPIGAMALFGGAYFSRARAFIFPLLTLWLSDILLNRFVFYGEWRFFYEGFYWTYGAFALMVLTGEVLLKKVNVKNVLVSSLIVVFIHWIVTDLGVWLEGTMYPKTLYGYWLCLVAAIPFERNFLIGTLLYSGIMFGAVEWLKTRYATLRTATE